MALIGYPEAQQRRYTSEEYFALKEKSDVRHEVFEGEVFAMAGTNAAHNNSVRNFILTLQPKLRGSGCRVKLDGMRLAMRDEHYYSPDEMVNCHADGRRAEQQYRHPVLIVEVLSPATDTLRQNAKIQSV